MDTAGFRTWLDAYFAAWVSNDAAEVAALFTEDAVYAVGPFAEPWAGRDAIVARWTSGPQDEVRADHEVLGVRGDVGVAHWNVRSTDPSSGRRMEMDGILLVTFAPDGRCRDHREWLDRRELPEA
jgi:uncharacterized protein (TIGR02246 family)